jgi:hypothetical protein
VLQHGQSADAAGIEATRRLQWDTDQESFYELYPIGQSGEHFGTIRILR